MCEIMLTEKERVTNLIEDYYKVNSFMHLCGIKIEAVSCGAISLGLDIDAAKHMNVNSGVHGGLIATIADNSLGVCAASVGKRVVTISTYLQFISVVREGEHIHTEARIVHQEGKLMLIQVDVKSGERLVMSSQSQMFIIGDFEGIPEKWE